MAIGTPTNKITSAGSIANSASYNTAAVTLDAGKWYTIQTSSYGATSHIVNSVVHDPAGTPLNFMLVSDGTTSARNQNWDAALHRVVEVWAVRPAATTASALITITFSGTQSAACWSLTEWATGVDPTTFAAKVKTSVDAGAATTASLTMNAFANSVNATFWVVALGTGTADPAENVVIGESRTELTEIDDAERSQHAVHYQNPNGNDTTLTATWTNAEEWGTIGIEVNAQSSDVTASSAMMVTPAVTGGETEEIPGTAALSIVLAVAGACTVANPVSASAALTIIPSVVAASTETIAGTGVITVVPAIVGAGKETIGSSAVLTIAPSVVGASTEQISSSAVLTVTPTVVGAGTETIASTATLIVVPSVVGAATAEGPAGISGSAALIIAPSVVGASVETISANAGFAVVPSVVGVATPAGGGISASAAMTIALIVSGSADVPLPAEPVKPVNLQTWERGVLPPGLGNRVEW